MRRADRDGGGNLASPRGGTVLRADGPWQVLALVRESGGVYWGGGHPHPDGQEPAWYARVQLPAQLELELDLPSMRPDPDASTGDQAR